jgi:hypothetical protein
MRQLFFIEGKLVGEAPRKPLFVHGEAQLPTSDFWFCAHCGELYARAPVQLPSGATTQWQSYMRCCRRCADLCYPSMGVVPGSIWLAWDIDFLAALPGAVLQWELERHLDHAERVYK